MEANFIYKLKREKGKLPFKCFNYRGVGCFIAKCPLKEKNDNDDESYREKGDKKKPKFRKGKFVRKSFISKNDNSSKDSDSEDFDEEMNEDLFMTFEEEKPKMKNKLMKKILRQQLI